MTTKECLPKEQQRWKQRTLIEERNFDKGELETGFRLEPGWKWSTSVKPMVNTLNCMQEHNGYIISGEMHIGIDDGQEAEVIGNEPFVGIDFTGAKTCTIN